MTLDSDNQAEMFYFGGTFPHDPFWTFNGSPTARVRLARRMLSPKQQQLQQSVRWQKKVGAIIQSSDTTGLSAYPVLGVF